MFAGFEKNAPTRQTPGLSRLCLAGLACVLFGCASPSPPAVGRIVDRLPPGTVQPAPPAQPKLSQQDLIVLARQGLDSDTLIQKIKDSGTRLRLNAAEIIALKTAGIPFAVIDHLLDGDRQFTLDQCNERILALQKEHALALRRQEAICRQQCTLAFPPWPSYPLVPHPRHW